MRYRVGAEAHGRIELPREIVVQLGTKEVTFEVNGQRYLERVTVTAPIARDDFESSYAPEASTDREAGFRIAGSVRQEMVAVLQGIESHLAFASGGALLRLEWHALSHELVADSAVERLLVPVSKVHMVEGWDPRSERIGARDLEYIVKGCETHRETVIPKAFWREGQNDFGDLRFVNAFNNFYFVIEGYFANGKFREAAVLREFAKSSELSGYIEWMINAAKTDALHWPALLSLYQEENCSPDVRGTERLLVRMRGRLHHFSSKSPNGGPVPFNQRDFFTLAWFTMGIALRVILGRDVTLGPLPHVSA